MNYLQRRFIALKIEILKITILLTLFLSFIFLFFHIFKKSSHLKEIIFSDILLMMTSYFSYIYINEKNYQFFAILEFFVILSCLIILSSVYPQNLYYPIWMFGTIIIFVLSTNILIGSVFLIISMIFFDFLFFKRLNVYSFLTLNAQFIAYFILGAILIKKLELLQEKIFIYEKLLYESSIKDALTQLFNRKYFEKTARLLLEKARRNNKKVMFLIIDIDFFKKINDTYGHPIGDLVLKKVAKTLKSNIRKSDLFARIGGEEFALLIDDFKDDFIIAEKLRKVIEDLEIETENDKIKTTISIGGIVSDKNYNYEYLYKKADDALYEAKKERNKVIIYKE